MIIKDELKRKNIIDRMIKEQDIISFYANTHFNKSLNILQDYDEGLYYSQIGDFIMENSEMLANFSVKNLYNVLASVSEDEDKKKINSFLISKLEKEDFFIEPIDLEFMMKNFYTSSYYSKIEENTRSSINEKLMASYDELKGTKYEKIIKSFSKYTDIANFLKYYKEGIFTDEKIKALEAMIDKNPNAMDNVNFGIFKDEIFAMGTEFCEYVSKFPSLSYQLVFLSEHAPELVKVISNRVKTYDNVKDNLDEIETLITYSARNAFELKNISINSNELIECAYRNSNDFGLINVPYGEDYEKRLNEELNRKYENARDKDEKLNIYLNKVYSISLDKSKKMLSEYGSDLGNLNLPEETLSFFSELNKIIQIDDETSINKMFENSTRSYLPSQIAQIKKSIANECAKDFSKEFDLTGKNLDSQNEDIEEIEFDGKKIKQINLHGKFNMLVHSTDSGFIRNAKETENYKEEWNSNKDKKNHIVSTTYINQDFIGLAPVGESGVRYGFAHLNESQIKLMGVTDLNTYSSNFAYDAATKQYMSSKTLLYNTRRVYSEFGIEREETNPDYIIICDDDSKELTQNAYKAASQFNIPIVYIDKQKIEQNQINNLDNLIEEFKRTQDTNTLKKLINAYETNMSGWLLNRSDTIENDNSYTADIDNSRFIDDFNNRKTQLTDLVQDFLSKENKENEIVEVIEILLEEIELYEDCEKDKPISKTKISFDANDLLINANEKLTEMGKDNLKVNLESGEKLSQYKLRINDCVKSFLSGEEPVTSENVRAVKEKMLSLEKSEITNDTKEINELE